jgi:hypothetical protein
MLLYMADSHFAFHNFFILYATHVLDSGGILCFCYCIPTILTMQILLRSLQFSLFFSCILCYYLQMDFYCLYSVHSVDIFIILFALFVGLLRALTTYIIGVLFLVW